MIASTALRSLVCLALGASVALSTPSTADAGQSGAEVAVPRAPAPRVTVAGGDLAGCWSAQRQIYGPHAFSFCSNGRYGSYRVRGGGLNCNGNVKIRRSGAGTFTVRLSRSRCNAYTDWSADYLVCRAPHSWGGYAVRPNAEVAVPRAPVPAPGGRLDCTYHPVAPGYHAIGLAMVRT